MPATIWIIFALVLSNVVTFGLWRHSAGELDRSIAKTEYERVLNERDEAVESIADNQRALKALGLRYQEIEKLKQENADALRKVTTGRPCLGAPAVRLLNTGLRLPETRSEPVPPDGAAATDSDVAQWINRAIGQYDECRSRIDAIAEFYR